MQVSVVAFRKLPRLSAAPQLSPEAVLGPETPRLDIPECSDPAAKPSTSLFRPCKAIGAATAHTAPIATPGSADRHIATLTLQLAVLPGVEALAQVEQRCLYTEAFALGGDAAELYIAARDTGGAGVQLASTCSHGLAAGNDGVPPGGGAVGGQARHASSVRGAGEELHGGVLVVQCRCGCIAGAGAMRCLARGTADAWG